MHSVDDGVHASVAAFSGPGGYIPMFTLFKMKDEKNQDTPSIPKDMTLDEVRLAMLELMAQENLNCYRIGQLYNHVVERKLAQLAGYKNAQDYFSKNLVDMAQSSLTLYGAVAHHFRQPLSRRFGMSCLYLLLSYA